MKRNIFVLLFMMVLAAGLQAQTVSVQGKGKVDATKWVNAHFAKGKVPPFSFLYGGEPSAKFITKWKYTKTYLQSDEQGGIKTRYQYTDLKTGMQVDCDVTVWADFDAVQWMLSFKNKGSQNSKTISEVKENDIRFSFPSDGLALHYANGSFPSRADFAPQDKAFKQGDSMLLIPLGGRSSGNVMPFFSLESPATHQGVVMGIGWTGKWKAQMFAPTNRDFAIETGINSFASYLFAGEQIR